ncbi:acetyl-CoA carboxylase, biotin carboxylase subunit [Spirosomataceae bacterium TFI 002]|nr:acetyl-CoA carboxylase, biotin carboxylase subunit [Spirosomataceae bacterium TFI 002]
MKKILIANRGEIALRVMKTIRKMGLKSVAVYSDVDRNSPHVLYGDEAVCLGAAPSSESYLNQSLIIAKAIELGVDGIHPGYGFLSENSVFAQKVNDAGMTFIGPDTYAIEVMGSKLAAKDCVKAFDIPMVPGTDTALESVDEAIEVAKEVGFPILIKASAGGGGKGMRIVEKESDLASQFERAVSEAKSAFGDGSVFIERYVKSPRHIEIQILADKHGNVVYLFERDCSIQRRHQKVVEEAPSAVLTPALRKQMGEAAVLVAKSCDYVGAGTVEFLMDDQLNFYFLEMNTRLQVEHPVSEMITGLDLVEWQIRVARGEHLAFGQDDLKINGHAIELRVYAEDPTNDFLPDIGRLDTYRHPVGEGIRVDDGFLEGMEIPIYYDPMISKLCVHAADRATAIQKMKEAIEQYYIEGVKNTLDFGRFVMEHEAFQSGNFDTHFVKNYFSPTILQDQREAEAKVVALTALKNYLDEKEKLKVPVSLETNWSNSNRT